jgi:hypothetical protein
MAGQLRRSGKMIFLGCMIYGGAIILWAGQFDPPIKMPKIVSVPVLN